MYKHHQPIIENYAAQSPEQTARVIKFVILTVQEHLERVKAKLENPAGPGVTQLKRRGMAYVDAHAADLYNVLFGQDDPVVMMERLCQIPGIAIVKAGFIVQLCRGMVGCLDTHNIKLYGLEAKAFRLTPSVTGLRERIRLYMKVCEDLGGPELLWDAWCEHVASLRPHWQNANHVSSAHVMTIVGG